MVHGETLDQRRRLPLRKERKLLVEDAGICKTITIMIFCHFSVTILCINVLFDLVVFGVPLYILWKLKIIKLKSFHNLTTLLIHWTTPIVFGFPLVLSGSRIFCDTSAHLIEAKDGNSLVLANHGSRIDWMIGMFLSHTKKMGSRYCRRARLGFVCEAPIQFMPLIGWYRKLVCDDIFVWRSFDKDAAIIKNNIQQLQLSDTKRMLVLSPEGVIVDFSESDKLYVQNCQEFCIKQGFKPFEYVLTPRYKGTSCLLDQVKKGDPIVSICIVYIKNNKLLNCRLVSSERVVPDIYLLTQGIGGFAVDVFVHTRRIEAEHILSDTKKILMLENSWKDTVLEEWEKQLENHKTYDPLLVDFEAVNCDKQEILLNHVVHFLLLIILPYSLDSLHTLFRFFICLFCVVSVLHTFGWAINSSSMESVPFETGIKAVGSYFMKRKQK